MSEPTEKDKINPFDFQITEGMVKRLMMDLEPRFRTILGDTLDTYEEVIENCTVDNEGGGMKTLYNERDNEINLYTTHERFVDTGVEKITAEMHEVVAEKMRQILSRIGLEMWMDFLSKEYDFTPSQNKVDHDEAETAG